MTVNTDTNKGLEVAVKKQTASQKAAAKRAKISAKTNFDNTYTEIIFPFVFDRNDNGTLVANTGPVAKATRSTVIKLKRYLVKRGKIDSTAGLTLNSDGTPQGNHTGFGAVKNIKVSFGSELRTRKPKPRKKDAPPLSAKYYAKNWYTFSVPKNATSTDILTWILKNWKALPDEFQMGERIYPVKAKKQAYNNPTPAQTAKSAKGKG